MLGDNRFPDGKDMGNVKTEESTMIPRCQPRLLKNGMSSIDLGKANTEDKERSAVTFYLH